MNGNRYTQYMYSYPHKTAYGPLEGISLSDRISCLSGTGHSLYLHLPFCETKCGYCNLFSVTGQSGQAIDRYLDAMERQLGQYAPLFRASNSEFTELTIGGGTPLLLSEDQLSRCFSMIRRHAPLKDNAEIIIETAPNQTVPEKLSLLKEAGVTRVSMGIQSFFDEELKTLRRSHRADRAAQALALLADSGFPCINVDFIYGIPGQSTDSFLASVRKGVSFDPDEVFLYPLYLKHGAGLERELGRKIVLNEALAFRQYEAAASWLTSHGYRQDSMRRFVKAASACEGREFSDCGFGSTLSIGCGGRSYLGDLHFCTPYSITQSSCLEELNRYENTEDYCCITHGILLSADEQKRRYLLRHLFIRPGLDLKAYEAAFQTGALQDFPIFTEWLEQGYLMRKGTFLTLTETGMGLSDYLGPMLISQEIKDRMNRWEERHGTQNASIPGELKKL